MEKKNKITQGDSRTPHIIQLTTPRMFNIDIADFVNSVRNAISVDFSRRVRLYDLYEDILQDTHLESVIGKRKARLHSVPIRFKKKNGEFDEAMDEVVESPWFGQFIDDALDAKFWGFSLFQFDKGKDGFITYQLINRKHVDPIDKEILHTQYDFDGLPFDEFYNLLLVGKERDLGLLAKVAPFVIYKRNSIGDWSQYSELFGMPIREYTYDASDNDARQRLLNDAKEQGAASVYIHPNDAGMNLIEAGGKSGSVEVYDKFVDRCNAEISKCILGNTLSTESSENGTQALGTVQKEGEDDISESDRRYILNILNYEVTDIFNALGLNTSGGKFEFEKDEDEDKEKQMRIVQGLWQMGLPIPDDYLYEKFNVEKPQKSGTALKREEPVEDPVGGEDPLQEGQEGTQQDDPKGEEHPDGKKSPANKRSRSLIDRLFTRWTDFFV